MCGIFGITDHKEAGIFTFLGIQGLQHRGQESAGIAIFDGEKINVKTGMGEVRDVFSLEDVKKLKGKTAIGHVRYSTAGSSSLKNAQPLCATTSKGDLALCHNGNLVNALSLRQKLINEGAILTGNSDSELILHLVARSSSPTMQDAILDALSEVQGAFSLIFLFEDNIMAVRDPNGFRPLCLGKVENSLCFSSETAAIELVKGKVIKELMPGEVVIASKKGYKSINWKPLKKHFFCIFEYVYFARPDSLLYGIPVSSSRIKMGKKLAQECKTKADVVIPVPDSGIFAAMGYAEESGIPLNFGLIRSHYIGRTFIQPLQTVRDYGVRLKLSPISSILKGKRVVLVDDSIVRGTTMRQIVGLLKNAGAKEVHVRISCPPTRFPCYYGIDTPTSEELIAHNKEVDEVCSFLGATSLHYLSLENMQNSVDEEKRWFCTACWDGNYPVLPQDIKQQKLFSLKK
ncbi:MAG: amidophosphoribosyltransferase [Thermoanaerobaculia bacterium]